MYDHAHISHVLFLYIFLWLIVNILKFDSFKQKSKYEHKKEKSLKEVNKA